MKHISIILTVYLITGCGKRQENSTTIENYYKGATYYEIEVYKAIYENGGYFDTGLAYGLRNGTRDELIKKGDLVYRKYRINDINKVNIDELQNIRTIVRGYDCNIYESGNVFYLEYCLVISEHKFLEWWIDKNANNFSIINENLP